jgi:hypothetical protein
MKLQNKSIKTEQKKKNLKSCVDYFYYIKKEWRYEEKGSLEIMKNLIASLVVTKLGNKKVKVDEIWGEGMCVL